MRRTDGRNDSRRRRRPVPWLLPIRSGVSVSPSLSRARHRSRAWWAGGRQGSRSLTSRRTSAFPHRTSRTTSVPRSLSLPEFFIDRSLARRDVAEALRGAGWLVRTHLEVFGDGGFGTTVRRLLPSGDTGCERSSSRAAT